MPQVQRIDLLQHLQALEITCNKNLGIIIQLLYRNFYDDSFSSFLSLELEYVHTNQHTQILLKRVKACLFRVQKQASLGHMST